MLDTPRRVRRGPLRCGYLARRAGRGVLDVDPMLPDNLIGVQQLLELSKRHVDRLDFVEEVNREDD